MCARYMKCKQPCPVFELRSLAPLFPLTITVTRWAFDFRVEKAFSTLHHTIFPFQLSLSLGSVQDYENWMLIYLFICFIFLIKKKIDSDVKYFHYGSSLFIIRLEFVLLIFVAFYRNSFHWFILLGLLAYF